MSMVKQAFTCSVGLPPPGTPWELLGVRPGSSREEIKAAFRGKAKRLHSDWGGSDAPIAGLKAVRDNLKEQAAYLRRAAKFAC